jgi:hypothetical protein
LAILAIGWDNVVIIRRASLRETAKKDLIKTIFKN